MRKKLLGCISFFGVISLAVLFAGCRSIQSNSFNMIAPPVTTHTGWIQDETFDKVVYFGTTRVDKCAPGGACNADAGRFDTGNERTAGGIKYGEATVKIPYKKEIGGIDGMSLEPNIKELSWAEVKRKISPNDVLVFIHGYNNSFKEAAIRCAQLSFDLNFPGQAVFFGWPAGANPAEYDKDKRRAKENVGYLSDFLTNIAGSTDKKVHIIAHSMGTYILSNALKNIEDRIKKDNTVLLSRRSMNDNKIFNEVILAAPDIAQDEFASLFTNYDFAGLAHGYTLYSTYNDIPLRTSRFINNFVEGNGQPRLGDSHNSFFTITGVDTVDAREEVTIQTLGHSYYANHSPLITDMYLLLHYGTPPDDRLLIRVVGKDNQKLWFLRAD